MSHALAPPVTVTVERLLLDGFDLTPAQGVIVQRAFERELAHLFTHSARAARWAGGSVPSVPAASVRVDGAPQPAQLGRDVARSTFATLRHAP